jgi:hypothetical protein
MNNDDIKKYREIVTEAWQTDADKKRGLVRHYPKPPEPEKPVDPLLKAVRRYIVLKTQGGMGASATEDLQDAWNDLKRLADAAG